MLELLGKYYEHVKKISKKDYTDYTDDINNYIIRRNKPHEKLFKLLSIWKN